MPQHVLTEVTARVDPTREDDLMAGFRELLRSAVPDGLLRTELLHGPEGHWRIQTLWRDRAALDAMRAGSQPPAAPALFRSVGADPSLTVLDVTAGHSVDSET
jgi:quinol monooxygenase YgiN